MWYPEVRVTVVPPRGVENLEMWLKRLSVVWHVPFALYFHVFDPRRLSSAQTPQTQTHRRSTVVYWLKLNVANAVVTRWRGEREGGKKRLGPSLLLCACVIFWPADDEKKIALFVCKRTQCALTLQPPADTYYCDSLYHTQARARTGFSQSERRR